MPQAASLTKWERLRRAQRGEPVDRPPISFWRHFPQDDPDPDALAAATVAFQRRHDLDLVKLMPSGMYAVEDYGVAVGAPDAQSGARARVGGTIARVDDLLRLPPVQPGNGALGRELRSLRAVRAALGPDTPVIETIFSPLTLLAKASPLPLDDTLQDLGERAGEVLGRLAEDVAAFAEACLGAGADGFFFATQWAGASFGRDRYDAFGLPHDLAVLDRVRKDARLVMLHLHGPAPLFDLADRYAADWVNWEDLDTEPALEDAARRTRAGLAGGLPRAASSFDPSGTAPAAYVARAARRTGGARLLLAPGCVLHQDVREEDLEDLRRAVEDGGSRRLPAVD